ncbi:hypothetical protein, partial [Pseudomonas syringae group genomosp. 7]|uniref:hypothetical protein n=1 Tax=Pseudomonas syringae group genomosp. 7 TaxID=251699 RepID=UPI00376F59B5
ESREQQVLFFGLSNLFKFEGLLLLFFFIDLVSKLIYTGGGTYAPVDILDLIHGRISGPRDGFGIKVTGDGSERIDMSQAHIRKEMAR